MQNLGNLNILRIPLQILWEFPNIAIKINEENTAFSREISSWFNKYEPPVQQEIRNQITWAINHPDYNFNSILKNVKTPNAEILFFFQFLDRVINY